MIVFMNMNPSVWMKDLMISSAEYTVIQNRSDVFI